jgi:hypothetical protein
MGLKEVIREAYAQSHGWAPTVARIVGCTIARSSSFFHVHFPCLLEWLTI